MATREMTISELMYMNWPIACDGTIDPETKGRIQENIRLWVKRVCEDIGQCGEDCEAIEVDEDELAALVAGEGDDIPYVLMIGGDR